MTDTHLSYLRHRNGRGKLFDTSEADASSYVDRHSALRRDSSSWHSRVERSELTGSVVSDSVVKGSSLLYTMVHSSVIEHSLVAAEFVGQNARIHNCEVTGKSRVSGAVLSDVRVANVTILPGVVCREWPDRTIDFAHGYIGRGTWTRPPRVFRISPMITLTESVAGYAFVHCREYAIDHLLRIGHKLGRSCGWTPTEILTVRRVLHLLQRERKRQHMKERKQHK